MKRILLSLSLILTITLGMAQTMTELAVPKYFAGKTASTANNARMPVYAAVKFSGLAANQSYDIRLGIGLTTDAATSYGAGNYWNGSTYSTTVWANAFTTDASGNSNVVWLAIQPTGNGTRFTPGDLHNIRVGIIANGGSMPVAPSFITTKTMTALDVNTTPLTSGTTDDAAFIKGTADVSASGKFVFVYNNALGSGDPLSIGVIRNHAYNQAGNNVLPAAIDSILKPGNNVNPGEYALVIPISANNITGVRRVESRDTSNILIASAISTNGIWPSTANSNTLLHRDILNLQHADAPLIPPIPFITVGTTGFTDDFGTTPPNTPSASSAIDVTGSNLNSDITITLPTPFEARVGSGIYSNVITLSNTGGMVTTTTVDIRFAPTSAGVYSDSIIISSPGAETRKIWVGGKAAAVLPKVQFLNVGFVQVPENAGTFMIPVTITDRNGSMATVNVVPNSQGTAKDGSQFTLLAGGQLVFSGSGPDTLYLQVNIIDDNISGPRVRRNKLGLSITNGEIGTNDSLLLEIIENDYTTVKISHLKRIDANGAIIGNDSIYQTTGVVYGGNTRNPGAGYSFTIIDDTDGISTFAPASASTFGYTITEGDSIMLRGHLTQFNGLAQLDFLDTIVLLGSGKKLKEATVVNTISESSENNLVRVNHVRLVNTATVNWTSGNHKVYNTVTNDTFEIRIIPVNNLVNMPVPSGEFSVTGLGGQFDNTSPYTSGYQLFPRYITDIFQDSLAAFDLVNPATNNTVFIQGDTAQTVTFNWTASARLLGTSQVKYVVMFDLPNGDFSNPVSFMDAANSGQDTFLTLTYAQLLTMAGGNMVQGDSAILKWTVKASGSDYDGRFANAEHTIILKRGIMNGVMEINDIARIYPNPAAGVLNVELSSPASRITLVSITGTKVKVIENPGLVTSLNVDGLSDGVYILVIENAGQVRQQKIVISNR